MRGAFLTNEHGKVMDVSGGVDTENRNVIVYNKHGGLNQQWDVYYVDQKIPGEPGKGELNEEWGLYVQRPFQIVSELGSHRYLDMLNTRQLAIKTRVDNRNSQQFVFDQNTLTIHPVSQKGWSWRRENNNNMFAQTTNVNNMQHFFKYEGQFFVNVKTNKVMTVKDKKDEEGQFVITQNRHGKNQGNAEQRWKVVYMDKQVKEQTSGYNAEWGFHINRPFYL